MTVFINPEEFGKTVKINGYNISVVVDIERLEWRHSKDYEGNIVGDMLYFAKAENFPGGKPKSGQAQMFDNKAYTVFDVKENDGIYEIVLIKNLS